MTSPISVVIPVYNAEAYVRQAVESALDQPETGEVVLVEDGSTDRSYDACRTLESSDSRVRLLQHEGGVNRGPGATRNLGLRSARNDTIAFLDADDFYLPGRFHSAPAVLDERPEADGVYEAVGTHCEDEEARERCRSQGTWELTTLTEAVPPERFFEAMFVEGKGGIHCDGLLVRRRIFDTVGGFDEELALAQDTALWIRMSLQAVLVPGRLDEPVAMRRVHAANRCGLFDETFWQCQYLLWKKTLDWGYANGVTGRRLDAILRNYVTRADAWLFGKLPWRRRKLRSLLHLLPLVARHPRLARSSFLRDYAVLCLRCCLVGAAGPEPTDRRNA